MRWEWPLWKVTQGYNLKINQILVNDKVVQTYPDNDGGRWYYDPETGRKVRLNE